MKTEWPVVMCPGCRVPMGVKKVTADGPGKPTGKVLYVCEICKTETRRLYKTPKAARDMAKRGRSETPR